ncbi:MAG TPA: secretin N-terminal domain-containing protein [Luteolibacter sp.]|nr:secretin N-terminal domain-containing protein [Luteolibacter sp.]
MKPNHLLVIALALTLACGISQAQDSVPIIEPTTPTVDGAPPQTKPDDAKPMIDGAPPQTTPDDSKPMIDGAPPRTTPEGEAPAIEASPTPAPPPQLQEIPAINPSQEPAPANGAFAPLEQQKRDSVQAADGYIIKDAGLNDIFQFLAKSAGRQYFHNVKIGGPEYLVTGHLNDGNPLEQMEELAFMYGLSLHIKGNTIYALTPAQLAQLPASEFHYQLKYLRPTDMEQIKALIQSVLTPGVGIVNFEPKTNTVIIIDSAHRIEQARTFLHSIDQAKGQIIVETKILRINSLSNARSGVDWSGSLGATGTTIELTRSLNSIFGIPSNMTEIPNTVNGVAYEYEAGANTVLSPIQMRGVLRALNDGKLARQVSNPTLITEDNEAASISIIDRIPIITQTSTVGGGSGAAQISEEVRYKIDNSDKAITEDPENHREIGIAITVTPTLLPDGTIRMKLRPRSAQVAEYVQSLATDNRYPRVTESMVESLARVPDGYSLVVGGFYGETNGNGKTKVPLLGDLPVINFFFKSKEASKEQTSLVFIVTPKSYNPSSPGASEKSRIQVYNKTRLTDDHDWVDPYNPGPAHEPNLPRSLRSMQPEQAPYYPRAEEVKKKKAPTGRP